PIRPTCRHISISPHSGLYGCPRCAFPPRRPASGSVLSLLTPSRHAASETSGSPSGARAQFFPDGIGLNRVSSGSALPRTPVIRFRRARHFAASLRFAFATACRVVGPLDGSDRAFAQPQGLLLPSFRSSRSPSSSSGIATVVSEHFHRWYFQPLEQQLASLHQHRPAQRRPTPTLQASLSRQLSHRGPGL